MAKAVGIGGVFLNFKGNKKELIDWYKSNLCLDMSSYGTGFIEGEQLLLLTFKKEDKPDTPFINFRVDDVETLIIKFKSEGLKVIREVTEFNYGKFARFVDPFGNIIELWEPYVETYKEMVRKEIKNFNIKKIL